MESQDKIDQAIQVIAEFSAKVDELSKKNEVSTLIIKQICENSVLQAETSMKQMREKTRTLLMLCVGTLGISVILLIAFILK